MNNNRKSLSSFSLPFSDKARNVLYDFLFYRHFLSRRVAVEVNGWRENSKTMVKDDEGRKWKPESPIESLITIKISSNEIYFRDCVTCEDHRMSDGIQKHSMRTKFLHSCQSECVFHISIIVYPWVLVLSTTFP